MPKTYRNTTGTSQNKAVMNWLFILAFIVAFLVAAVFLYAGVLKAWEPIKFAEDIQKYHILSWPLGMGMAFYLPWLEIICGLALLTRWLRRGAAAILTLLPLALGLGAGTQMQQPLAIAVIGGFSMSSILLLLVLPIMLTLNEKQRAI